MAEFNVEIGADNSKLNKKLQESQSAMIAFEKKAQSLKNQLEKNAISSINLDKAIGDLERSFKSGKIEASTYANTLANFTGKQIKLADSTKSLRTDLSKTNGSIRDLGVSATKSAKGVVSGSSAMTAFSRTVQDAPFGLMGVSNNITNLTEQFGYLKNKTGSAGGALKAMMADIKGFGGITLAISVATSAMLMFGDKLFATKDKAKALKEEQEKLTQALKDYEDQLDANRKSELIGGRAAASELTTLKLLKNQVFDNTRSQYFRNKALDELKKIYPSYLKDMTTDISKQDDLTRVLRQLEKEIQLANKAKAASNLISENQRKLTISQIQLDEKLATTKKLFAKTSKDERGNVIKYGQAYIDYAKSLLEVDKIYRQINPLIKDNANLMQVVRDSGGIVPLDFSVKKVKIDTSAFDAATSDIKLKIQEINSAYSDTSLGYDKRLGLLAQSFTKESELIALNTQNRLNNIKKSGEKEATILNEAETDKLKLIEKYNGLGDAQSKTYVADRLSQISTNSAIELKGEEDAIINKYKALGDLTKKQEAQRNKELSDLKISSFNENIATENAFLQQLLSNQEIQGQLRLDLEKRIQENISKLRSEGLSKFSEDVEKTVNITNHLNSALSLMASSLGNSLAAGTDAMDALGASLLGSVGSLLTQLGTLALQIGIGLEAIKASFKSLNPAVAIGAGIALIALGSYFTSKASSMGNSIGAGGSGGSSGSSRGSNVGSNIGTNAGDTSNVSRGSSFGSSSSFNSGSGNVVFEIQGTKLVGVLNNTLKQNRSLSGTLSLS